MDMAMTEPATRKREYSKQSEMSCSWRNSPFAPFTKFGLATGSEMGPPPLEKGLRTENMTVSTFKWEPDVPGSTQFSAGYGFRDVKVRTPLTAALQEQPSRGYSSPHQVRLSREKYEGVKQELMQRSSWIAKLDNSTMLAEDALDKVGRPRIGLNSTLGPTQSYFQKFADAKRELEEFKRVAQAVNSWVPLSSKRTSPAFSSLERMRRRDHTTREIGALEENLTRLRNEREEGVVRRQKEGEASKKEAVAPDVHLEANCDTVEPWTPHDDSRESWDDLEHVTLGMPTTWNVVTSTPDS